MCTTLYISLVILYRNIQGWVESTSPPVASEAGQPVAPLHDAEPAELQRGVLRREPHLGRHPIVRSSPLVRGCQKEEEPSYRSAIYRLYFVRRPLHWGDSRISQRVVPHRRQPLRAPVHVDVVDVQAGAGAGLGQRAGSYVGLKDASASSWPMHSSNAWANLIPSSYVNKAISKAEAGPASAAGSAPSSPGRCAAT